MARLCCLFILMVLAGCGSVAKGVTEAILEQDQKEDTRQCHIEGPAASGLEALMREQEAAKVRGDKPADLKILMVHGIGRHIPGYSRRLQEGLMRELQLTVAEEQPKEIKIRSQQFGDLPLGNLRISRFMNEAGSRELLFYELTWSEIIEAEKSLLEFDESGEYTFRRTGINNLMKGFFNSHIPDPLIYLGEAQKPIITAVRQSICWSTLGDWSSYPRDTTAVCDYADPARIKRLRDDDLVLITHSLGSRIAVDTLQFVARTISDQPEIARLRRKVGAKKFSIYMLANQLPLLELGRKPAEVRGQIPDYCYPEGSKYSERLLSGLNMYLFSDPNDILSYGIPPGFADRFLDSRLCPKITNIILNVAEPISLFGLGKIANPVEAHVGYDHDERVLGFIAHGIGHEKMSSIVKERCTWIKSVRGNRPPK